MSTPDSLALIRDGKATNYSKLDANATHFFVNALIERADGTATVRVS